MRRPLTAAFKRAKAHSHKRDVGTGGRALAEDLIGYDQLTQDAMRDVVRAALQRAVGARGLPGRQHFYLTFRTR